MIFLTDGQGGNAYRRPTRTARGATVHLVRFPGSPWPVSRRRRDARDSETPNHRSACTDEKQSETDETRAHGTSDRNGLSAVRSLLDLVETELRSKGYFSVYLFLKRVARLLTLTHAGRSATMVPTFFFPGNETPREDE